VSGSAPTQRWALARYVNGAPPNSIRAGDLSGSVRARLALDLGAVDADDTRTALSG
jgi:hypothetical protein